MGKKSSGEQLNEEYVDELLACCLKNKMALATIVEHMKPQWLPTEEHGKVFKAIKSHWTVYQKPIGIGQLMQKFDDDDDIIDLLSDIRDIDVEEPEAVLDELEEFITDALVVEMTDKLRESWNKGDKNKAKSIAKEYSDKIHNFTIKSKAFTQIFSGFEDRVLTAKANRNAVELGETDQQPMWGIDCLDEALGYLRTGNVYCYLASSGVGKSTVLRWNGVYNARLGFDVLHLQLEGSEKEVQNSYDSTWTKIHSSTVEHGLIDPESLEKLAAHAQKIRGEIHVRAFETFGSASTVDVRQSIIDTIKSTNRKPKVVIIDYLEKLEPSGKRQWKPDEERHRRGAIADELKNIAVEFDIVIITATQANSVSPEKLELADFVLTRHNVGEAKNIIQPLTVLVTLNQTTEEYENEEIRLYIDKSRFTKGKQIFRIFQNRNSGRFYDRKRSLNIFGTASKKKKTDDEEEEDLNDKD
jgi:replicative DNA helicase